MASDSEFFKSIKAGNIGSVYVLYGPEVYVRDQAMAQLRQKLLPEGLEQLNENLFEGAFSVSDLIDAAETVPFMGEKRLVIVRNWILLGKQSNKKGGQDDSADDDQSDLIEDARAISAEADRFAKWLENIPDTCCLVFINTDTPNTHKKVTKALEKKAEWVQFALLDDEKLFKWCSREVEKLGHAIQPEAVDQLAFMTGRALTAIKQELDKLCAYVGARKEITREDVEAVVTPSTECTVFQMIDCLMNGQANRAQMLLKNMLENGESRVGTIAMLTRQLRILTHIRLMRAQGQTLAEIERKLSLKHFVAVRSANQASRFSVEGLEAGYKACVDADYAFKSGRMRDAVALDRLMIQLSAMK